MKTLITPAQVVALAFADGEFIAPEAISEADIAAAEQRYIVPVIGRRLHTRLTEQTYAAFTEEYLAASVALFTRAMIQPLLDIRTGQCGTIAPRSAAYEPAGEASLHRLQQVLRIKARTLLRRAAAHLSENAAQFPEYDDEVNILKRCTIDGNLIQTH